MPALIHIVNADSMIGFRFNLDISFPLLLNETWSEQFAKRLTLRPSMHHHSAQHKLLYTTVSPQNFERQLVGIVVITTI